MKRFVISLLLLTLVLSMDSCENVFHNDKLDFMWRLDSVEYLEGKDLYGNPCDVESKEGAWFSFARDLVEIENHKSLFSAIGVLTDKGNSLVFDFSMYEDDWPGIEDGLKMLGIDAKVSQFSVTELNGKKMILTGSKTVLKFTKW